jgi:ABC-type transporter Mla MlaB component
LAPYCNALSSWAHDFTRLGTTVLNPFHVSLDRGTQTLTLSGVIDHDSFADLSAAVSEALAVLPHGVVLDLTNVEELPISALFLLFMAHDEHRATPMPLHAGAGSPASFVLARMGYPSESAVGRQLAEGTEPLV